MEKEKKKTWSNWKPGFSSITHLACDPFCEMKGYFIWRFSETRIVGLWQAHDQLMLPHWLEYVLIANLSEIGWKLPKLRKSLFL